MDDMLAGVSPRVECTVAPTDPGWAAGGRRRERLHLPRAYDKYYDGDLGASTRHSCTPSAHTGPPSKLLWGRAALVVTPHPRARLLSPDVPPRTQVKAGSVTPTFTFFPPARRVSLVVCGARRMYREVGHRRAERKVCSCVAADAAPGCRRVGRASAAASRARWHRCAEPAAIRRTSHATLQVLQVPVVCERE
ncbi:hypothetical protein B0H14DRAFT_1238333 [Mycena olivaceomarginata]|nr:hypothetical protein B0H14DRAFT_1238333 [Mycena olivaceomarginata]